MYVYHIHIHTCIHINSFFGPLEEERGLAAEHKHREVPDSGRGELYIYIYIYIHIYMYIYIYIHVIHIDNVYDVYIYHIYVQIDMYAYK